MRGLSSFGWRGRQDFAGTSEKIHYAAISSPEFLSEQCLQLSTPGTMAPASLIDLISTLPETESWGPQVTNETMLDGVPYAPYSKADRLGRMADWTDGKDRERGGRQQYGNRNYRGNFSERTNNDWRLTAQCRTASLRRKPNYQSVRHPSSRRRGHFLCRRQHENLCPYQRLWPRWWHSFPGQRTARWPVSARR